MAYTITPAHLGPLKTITSVTVSDLSVPGDKTWGLREWYTYEEVAVSGTHTQTFNYYLEGIVMVFPDTGGDPQIVSTATLDSRTEVVPDGFGRYGGDGVFINALSDLVDQDCEPATFVSTAKSDTYSSSGRATTEAAELDSLLGFVLSSDTDADNYHWRSTRLTVGTGLTVRGWSEGAPTTGYTVPLGGGPVVPDVDVNAAQGANGTGAGSYFVAGDTMVWSIPQNTKIVDELIVYDENVPSYTDLSGNVAIAQAWIADQVALYGHEEFTGL